MHLRISAEERRTRGCKPAVLDMPEITGTQIIYAGSGHALDWLPELEGRCRVCGGRLLAPTADAYEARSENWTDENLVADFASQMLCAACVWSTTREGRNYISGGRALYATPIGNKKLPELEDLFEVLKVQFHTPAVFIATGSGSSANQKHVIHRANRAVTWSRANTHVLIYGINMVNKYTREILYPHVLANWAPSTAILTFDADAFVQLVERLTAQIRPVCNAVLQQAKKRSSKNALVATVVNEFTRAHGEILLDPVARFAVRIAVERAATAEGVPWKRE